MSYSKENEVFTIDTLVDDNISLRLLARELNMDKDELWRLIMMNNKNYTHITNYVKVKYISFGKDPDRMIFLNKDEVKEALNAMFQYKIRKAKGLI